ncbi:probable 6-phosphogluconolactonase ARB_02015 [Trichoderma asperellum]|uniref:Probable 6-phosphogluconolactonase ARB_02015 n=1 Tax=Trichoderma asperellum TaxID=101201 RepID=A0A6V8QWP6_TRIAP|nr:probable 6-phosphogluconolactonase ARB_02015 [Trichoderma asperellum]
MRISSTLSAALVASPALAAPTAEAASSTAKVVYANSGHIYLASYDGSKFIITVNSSFKNTDPSWLAFVQPNSLYAVNDIASNTYLYNIDVNGNTIKQVTNKQGSGGVVHLETNKAGTRMLGAGYGSGKIDVWNIENGGLSLIKSISSPGPLGPDPDRQDAPHPHQTVNDPTGRYFFANDLGTDSVLVIDSQDDAFNIVNRMSVVPAGSGPRHGVFYPFGAAKATHYFLLCEMGNVVISYKLNYTDNGKGIEFTTTQVLNTFGPNSQKPAGAGAGELVLSPDNKDLYLSNRLTGQATDNIAHIKLIDNGANNVQLLWINSVSSGGTGPRMFSISNDGSSLFVTNQDGALGVAAISRNAADGSLDANFHGSISNSAFGGQGPQYIKQIQ